MKDSPEPTTSSTLLEALRNTAVDSEAWTVFVKRYEPLIHDWCRRWELQDADVQDVTQDVLLRLVEQMRTFNYKASLSFRGWLRTLTLHAWSDFLAKRSRLGRGSGHDQVFATLNNVAARDDLVARLERQYDLELLQRAEERVQPRVQPNTWEAYRLAGKEGLSGQEAAQKIGISVATVYVCKNRVQQMIREEIQRLEGPEPQGQEEGR